MERMSKDEVPYLLNVSALVARRDVDDCRDTVSVVVSGDER